MRLCSTIPASRRAIAELFSYSIDFDAVVQDLTRWILSRLPQDVYNNLKSAVHQWLQLNPEFEIDKFIDVMSLIGLVTDWHLVFGLAMANQFHLRCLPSCWQTIVSGVFPWI